MSQPEEHPIRRLFRRVHEDDPCAEGELYEACKPLIRNQISKCFYGSREDKEEILQDALRNVLRYAKKRGDKEHPDYPSNVPLVLWFANIRIRDRIRKLGAQKRRHEQAPVELDADSDRFEPVSRSLRPDEKAYLEERHRFMRHCLMRRLEFERKYTEEQKDAIRQATGEFAKLPRDQRPKDKRKAVRNHLKVKALGLNRPRADALIAVVRKEEDKWLMTHMYWIYRQQEWKPEDKDFLEDPVLAKLTQSKLKTLKQKLRKMQKECAAEFSRIEDGLDHTA